jgi:hypothetical protein
MGHATHADFVTVTDGGRGEASEGAGLGLLEGVTWALGAGALGAGCPAALVKYGGNGRHGWQVEVNSRLSDR